MPGIIRDWRCWCSRFVGLGNWLIVGSLLIALLPERVFAQITPDSTLPNNSSVTTDRNTFNITGGTQAGSNLFHSFSEFSVPTGSTASFNNAVDIQNIISRVTGRSASNIDGLIRAYGTANLFLINPNGIIFGKDARLDIGGSFLASTASSLNFADSTQFSTTGSQTTPLLSISMPLGLQLGTNNSGTIKSAGNLAVRQDLTLAAGNLDLQGQLQAGGSLTLQASDTVRLTDSAENPLVAKAGSHLVVQGQAVDIFALNHPASGLFSGGDMVLRSANTVAGDAHYTTGGNFRIEQLDGQLGSLFSPYDPIIRASGDVTFNNYIGASLHILAGGSVNIPGNVRITGRDTQANSIVENVTLSDGSTVVAINGNAQPTLDIRAGTTAFGTSGITGTTGFSLGVPSTNGNGTSADITIGSITNGGGIVFLTNQYAPSSSLPGGAIQVGATNTSVISGNAGSITIDSRGSIKLRDTLLATVTSNGNGGTVTFTALKDITTGSIITYSGFRSRGNAGNISLTSTTGAIDTTAGSLDAGTTFGNGGTISLKAQSDITTADLRSYVVNNGRGDAGNISLTSTGGAIDTKAGTLDSASNEGNGGDITFNANGNITTGNIFSVGGELTQLSLILNRPIQKKGNGGNITLNSNANITTSSGSQIYSNGGTSGGNITFASNAGISLVNSNIYSQTSNLDGSGKAGDINIKAKSVSLTGSRVSSGAFIQGDGGNLTVNASELVEVAGTLVDQGSPFGLFTGTAGTGKAGDLTIDTRYLTVEKGAVIGSFTLGLGEAGDLTVKASESIKLNGTSADAQTPSALFADTAGVKNAGDMIINTSRLIVQDGAAISVSTFGSGQGGRLIVNASESIELSNTSSNGLPSGLYAQSFFTGTAGNLEIYTRELSLKDKARITVAAGNAADINVPRGPSYLRETLGFKVPLRNPGGKAGNLDISARAVKLDGQAKITGETTSGNGGNITMRNLDLLLMRHGSEISTTAGTAQQGGNGGNITINAPNGFIIAVPNENSNISANAFTGTGGRVQINASGIYGIQYQKKENPLTSDITASSEFGADGTIELNTPEVDPNSGLVELPTIPVDTEVAQGCYSPSYTQSSFVVNGRGGLPPNPKDILTPETPQIDWVSVKPSNNNHSLPPVTSKPTASTPKRIVEATGAVLNAKGQIVFSANSSTVSSHTSKQNPIQCHGS
jgi:filamentous hemagglutinin family protein